MVRLDGQDLHLDDPRALGDIADGETRAVASVVQHLTDAHGASPRHPHTDMLAAVGSQIRVTYGVALAIGQNCPKSGRGVREHPGKGILLGTRGSAGDVSGSGYRGVAVQLRLDGGQP